MNGVVYMRTKPHAQWMVMGRSMLQQRYAAIKEERDKFRIEIVELNLTLLKLQTTTGD